MSRAWLSVAMLLAGTGLLVSAGHASGSHASKLRQGGTLRVNLPVTDIDDIDPSIAYGDTSWHIEYSTALKLFNYPEAPASRRSQLVPEGASSFKVSRDGTKYTFTIRRGFRFSDGTEVTAQNYAFAINRALGRDLQSPAFQFVADSWGGENIVGAQDGAGRHRGHGPGRAGAREQADHQADEARRHVPLKDHDAVLPGDSDDALHDRQGHSRRTRPTRFHRPVRTTWPSASRTASWCSGRTRTTRRE